MGLAGHCYAWGASWFNLEHGGSSLLWCDQPVVLSFVFACGCSEGTVPHKNHPGRRKGNLVKNSWILISTRSIRVLLHDPVLEFNPLCNCN